MTAKETFEKHCPDLHEDTDHVVIENIIIAMEEYKDTEIKEARELLNDLLILDSAFLSLDTMEKINSFLNKQDKEE